jgi:hypothetical protein
LSLPTAPPSGFAARLEHLVDVDAHEGPVYVPGEDALYFTSVPRSGPRVDIKRLDLGSLTVSVIRLRMRGRCAVAAASGQLEVRPGPRYVEEDPVVAVVVAEAADLG